MLNTKAAPQRPIGVAQPPSAPVLGGGQVNAKVANLGTLPPVEFGHVGNVAGVKPGLQAERNKDFRLLAGRHHCLQGRAAEVIVVVVGNQQNIDRGQGAGRQRCLHHPPRAEATKRTRKRRQGRIGQDIQPIHLQ